MEPIIKLINLDIKNIKNISHGELKKLSTFSNIEKSSIIGIYGQNGSGKTALVESLQVLKTLLSSKILPEKSNNLIMFGQKESTIEYEFIVKNLKGEFFIKYIVSLTQDKNQIIITKESIYYKENIENKRYKEIISVNQNTVCYRNNNVEKLDEEVRIKTLAQRIADYNVGKSFVFLEKVIDLLSKYLDETEKMLIDNITKNFNRDFHIIDDTNTGLILANVLMPLSFSKQDIRGRIPYKLKGLMILPKEIFNPLKDVIKQINIVLCKIIPDLNIEINELGKETIETGEQGIRFELLSKKDKVKLPLRCESAGTLKLISILSLLIGVFNNPNALVIIDELDSGVFEYLLGEILSVINNFGKGQLIFTSHNLRVLEVLNKNNLWFTSVNPEKRFIQLKYVTNKSNMRDIYLRAVQLGGQEEELYNETDWYFVEKAFRMSGLNYEKE